MPDYAEHKNHIAACGRDGIYGNGNIAGRFDKDRGVLPLPGVPGKG